MGGHPRWLGSSRVETASRLRRLPDRCAIFSIGSRGWVDVRRIESGAMRVVVTLVRQTHLNVT